MWRKATCLRMSRKLIASLHYKELPLLALNHNGKFERADSGVITPLAARGAAFGDINNDGRMDAISHYSWRTAGAITEPL